MLRLLLWDEVPLVDQINREFRQKLAFPIGKTIQRPTTSDEPAGGSLIRVKSGLMFQAAEDSFFSEAGYSRRVTRKQLYKLPVLRVGEHIFTVLELMRHMAYVGGTIHALDPENERDQVLHEFRGLIQVQGVGPGLRTLRAIGRVVLAGLAPLRQALVEQVQAG